MCFYCFTGYYFNKTGLLACEPFYSKSSYRILSSCALYFPTTMVLMYCYGSSFHANRYICRPTTPISTTSMHTQTSPSAHTPHFAEKVNYIYINSLFKSPISHFIEGSILRLNFWSFQACMFNLINF